MIADGFRKVRSDLNQNALWWEFKHPLFRRGQPELLVEIKKSVHFEPPSAAPTAESFNELRKEMGTLKDQIRMMESMVKELSLGNRSMIGIAPHHVGGGAGSGQMGGGMSLAGVGSGISVGIPLNMSSPAPTSTNKKRQRVSSSDVVPMQPAGMPAFYDSILGNDPQGMQIKHEPMQQFSYGASASSSSAGVHGRGGIATNDMKSMDDPAWDETLETFFDADLEEVMEEHDDDDGEQDEMDDDNMFVVPATIVMNEASMNTWEWAAVGQVLDDEGQQNCQVDQLADVLLFSSLAPGLTTATSLTSPRDMPQEEYRTDNNVNAMATPGTTEEVDAAAKATAAQLESLNGIANVDVLISGLLLLPKDLQERFVDRLADVLGKQLSDHLARQADEVHIAMVEASYAQGYYAKKESESLMDVSHYTQVIAAHSGPETPADGTTVTTNEQMPTTVASRVPATGGENMMTSEVHALAQVIGSAAGSMNHALPFVVGYQPQSASSNPTIPNNAYNLPVPVASTVIPSFPQSSVPAPSYDTITQQFGLAPGAPSAPVMPSAPAMPPSFGQNVGPGAPNAPPKNPRANSAQSGQLNLNMNNRVPSTPISPPTPDQQQLPLPSSARGTEFISPGSARMVEQQQQQQQQPNSARLTFNNNAQHNVQNIQNNIHINIGANNANTANNPSAGGGSMLGCFPCETCAHCRANALLNSYQPQQLQEAYPLAAAALGALLLRWGEACTRHQS
jgi:hypothetical protein